MSKKKHKNKNKQITQTKNQTKKNNKFVQRYLIDALSGMSLGLFSTLIIGLIIGQIGKFFPSSLDTASVPFLYYAGKFLINIGKILTVFTGAAIGCGAAHSLNAPKLGVYSSIITGTVGAYATEFLKSITSVSVLIAETGGINLQGPGDPLSAFIAAVVGAELSRLVYKKTKCDILVVPAVTIISGVLVALLLGPYLATATKWIGEGINHATELQPILMGIIVSVVMGMLLTLPVSSAAIAIMFGIQGLAGGSATAGCSAQMIGFAIISFKDNGFNGLISQGLGTSMLQMPNIVKNPRIWLPAIIASAITGPISTTIFKLKTLSGGSGMGTSGLVGQIMTYQAMIGEESTISIILKILAVDFILPAILSFIVYKILYKKAWIKDNDMRLST